MRTLIILSALVALAAVATVSGSERVTRQIAGGARKLQGQELVNKQRELAKALSLLATGTGPFYTIDKVYSGTTQVVAGSLDKLDVDLIDSRTGKKSRCLVSMLQKPGENGYQLTFECRNKPTLIRHSRSVENKRIIRQVPGGVKKLQGKELVNIQRSLSKSLRKIATGDGPFYTVDKVYSATTQNVAGALDKIDVDLIDSKTGEKSRCLVTLLSKPWLQENGYELTFECRNKPTVVRQHS